MKISEKLLIGASTEARQVEVSEEKAVVKKTQVGYKIEN